MTRRNIRAADCLKAGMVLATEDYFVLESMSKLFVMGYEIGEFGIYGNVPDSLVKEVAEANRIPLLKYSAAYPKATMVVVTFPFTQGDFERIKNHGKEFSYTAIYHAINQLEMALLDTKTVEGDPANEPPSGIAVSPRGMTVGLKSSGTKHGVLWVTVSAYVREVETQP
jgi:hypothetical protein